MSMVPSGSPSPPYRLVTSWPRIVPTVRLTLRIASWARTGSPRSSASPASATSSLSSALASPWSCVLVRCRGVPSGSSGTCRTGVRSRPPAFQWSTAFATSSISAWPTASSMLRKPSAARCSRTSSAMYSKKLTTNSGLPVNRSRSTGFCVATPTGQVSRWQTRIMMQPDTTSGAVAKPNSSAPSSAAMTRHGRS